MPHAASPRAVTPPPLLEICVESLPEAIGAVGCGAGRLEICSCMAEAGTTPSIGLVEELVERFDVPSFVMIRPRGGDFVFDDGEISVMLRDIDAAKRAGAQGIVSGALDSHGLIDRETTERLVERAAPLPFTFHRAIDLTYDLELALEALRSIGVRRVLTSGGASSALVGADVIASLARSAGPEMTIVAGGGVRADNVAEIVRRTGITEVHARPTRASALTQAGTRDIRFGSNPLPVTRQELDPREVRALSAALSEID